MFSLLLASPESMPGCRRVSALTLCYSRLSRIVANVLRDLYSIRPPSTENQFKLAAKYSKEIDDWRSGVAFLVDTNGIDPSLFQPIFLRQRNVLNLGCWHAQLLVHRPFILNNFASLSNLGTTRRNDDSRNSKQTAEHVQKCLEAAMNIVNWIDNLHSTGQFYNTLWVSANMELSVPHLGLFSD